MQLNARQLVLFDNNMLSLNIHVFIPNSIKELPVVIFEQVFIYNLTGFQQKQCHHQMPREEPHTSGLSSCLNHSTTEKFVLKCLTSEWYAYFKYTETKTWTTATYARSQRNQSCVNKWHDNRCMYLLKLNVNVRLK